jgi:uncharacterized 2Fe-2S/4Fe-4S cluster protein (DUF4445 family)
MANSVLITIQGGQSCEARQGESVLSALVRAGVVLQAPCGGRGICGKCKLTLLKGKVRLLENGAEAKTAEVKEGEAFCACKAEALCDITVSLPDDDAVADFPDAPLAVIGADRKIRRAGVGVDIGTTTVQAQVVDLDSGEVLQTFSALNNQRSFGADVMSRINCAREGKTRELFTVVNRQVEEILRTCIANWKLSRIEQCAVTGNTTMLHLFAGVDPSAMGEAPYSPAFLEERSFEGTELSLSADRVTLLPGISAFVGADIVSGLAFIDIMNRGEDSLFVDIGTNGEIAVWKESEKKLYCCSTAAGPCFEGAEISCGMGASLGAINRISLKKEELSAVCSQCGPLFYTTLGNAKARGICGAGLIDALAVMRKLGAIDETGALADEYSQAGFPVAEGIVVTQRDVRQFQLAKSAIFSGVKVLFQRARSAKFQGYIAGGLGFFINLENACNIGLLPGELAKKASVCGNTSLMGAVKSLRSPAFLSRCREIAESAVTVELALDNDFSESFMGNMGF